MNADEFWQALNQYSARLMALEGVVSVGTGSEGAYPKEYFLQILLETESPELVGRIKDILGDISFQTVLITDETLVHSKS